MSEPRFPNVEFARRMPLKRLSWRLAWWLMKRVVLRGHTRHQQAFMIDEALGAYRPVRLAGTTWTGTTAGASSVTYRPKS